MNMRECFEKDFNKSYANREDMQSEYRLSSVKDITFRMYKVAYETQQDKITALEARNIELESALTGLLEHESDFSSNKGDCNCNFKSRELSIKYENLRCPHQLARKALATHPTDAPDRFENEEI
jgi:hypothetical protein